MRPDGLSLGQSALSFLAGMTLAVVCWQALPAGVYLVLAIQAVLQ
jgi:hypothetical protein